MIVIIIIMKIQEYLDTRYIVFPTVAAGLISQASEVNRHIVLKKVQYNNQYLL